MSEVDLQSLPPLLTADIQRTQGNGLPTEALQDWEQFQQNWFVNQAVALDTKLTTVSSQTDNNTASITNEITARTSADAAEATARLTLEAKVDNNEAGIQTTLTALANQDTAFAQDLETLTATVNDNQATTSTQLTALANADTALSARQDTVETTLGGQTATISELTASVNGIAVQKVLTATINNVTGGYEFAGVKNADGTGATFTMTFNSNVVINGDLLVNGTVGRDKLAPGAILDLGNPTYAGGEVAIGLGMTSNTNQHFADCVANFQVEGDCVVDVTFQAVYRISAIGGTGNFVNLTISAFLDGRFLQTLYTTGGSGFFGAGSVTATTPISVKLFLTGANALTPGTHQLYFATSYSGSSGTCSAYMENGTNIAFMVFKAT